MPSSRQRGRGATRGSCASSPDRPTSSGRRGHHWLKVKRPLDTLDVVVVGAEWGHGKRRGVLSDLTFAVRDPATGDLVTIGKAYNGLTDAEIRTMTDQLIGLTVHDTGHYRTVRPEIVLEVAFDRIQRSARHGAGFALRFPRIVASPNRPEPVRYQHAGRRGPAARGPRRRGGSSARWRGQPRQRGRRKRR